MNPYQVLGITKYSSNEEVRLAYKRMMKKHHPDSGDGDTEKLEQARSAYTQLLTQSSEDKTLSISITVPVTQADLASFLGKTKTIEYEGIHFDVLIPYETRMNDTITVKDILPDTTLKIKFKEQNE
jgi:hypothetical protein